MGKEEKKGEGTICHSLCVSFSAGQAVPMAWDGAMPKAWDGVVPMMWDGTMPVV